MGHSWVSIEHLSRSGVGFFTTVFKNESEFENDYEELCDCLNRKGVGELSIVKGCESEAVLISIPLPTLIVEANGTSIHIVQIWSSEQGWSESSLTTDDFRSVADWQESVEFFCAGGEFLIFDSSCSYEDIDEHFSIFLEKGTYKCGSCYQKREGQAEIVLIRMVKQA